MVNMEAVELMYYTITTTLIIITVGIVAIIFQISLFFITLRRLLLKAQNISTYTKFISAGIKSGLLSLILNLFRKKR